MSRPILDSRLVEAIERLAAATERSVELAEQAQSDFRESAQKQYTFALRADLRAAKTASLLDEQSNRSEESHEIAMAAIGARSPDRIDFDTPNRAARRRRQH